MVYSNGTTGEKKAVVENPDDIVIAGMSVRCANSDNVEEFAKNLFAGVNMVHENLKRCDQDFFGVPKQHGFIKDIRKFDAQFFNVHPKQAEGMDPQLRILHEVAYESIIDGGVDPAELKNSNTGVFIGTSNSDAREAWTAPDVSDIDGYSLIGTHRAFLANRLSFTFDLRGPSFGVDAACATTGVAINQGYLHIKNGQCDAALVGGVSLVYQPKIAYQIMKLGLLAKDGKCKVFDEAADGYVRSEAIVCILLQKRKNARRIYATLVHSKINNDGFKEQGVTYPSTESQGQLVAEVYEEAGVDPEDVEYVETHGTGTKIGDPQETNGIALGFAGTRKKPLPIGAVKSNVGHSEHASGGVATIKVLIAMQSGVIPPNLHYKTPNPLIPALVDGRLKVVTEPMKWNSTLAGVNSFGFGGQNSHIILRGNPNVRKETLTNVQLTVYMGRTEEAARFAMEYINRYPENPYVPFLLMQSAYAKPASMPYRGYTITNGAQPVTVVDRVSFEHKPVWFIFSGQGTQWAAMGKDMMRLESFRSVAEKCAQTLTPFGLNLIKILTSALETDYNDPIISFVGIAAIQIALVELLRSMEISPEGLIGHSAGEIGCAFADGCFSIEEAMLVAYWRGRAVKKAQLELGAMASVGLSWNDATTICDKYSGVVPACNNADDNVTVSGPVAEVAKLVADLKSQNIFAKEVNSNGIAFHSPAMQQVAPIYLDALKKVLLSPKKRTTRWLSTAVNEDQWATKLAQYASAEYFAHNLSSTVKFNEALKKVPVNAIAIEIAPHGLLQALIRKTVGEKVTPVALMKSGTPDTAIHFLESIGKLYILGLNPRVLNIFPKPSLPAPRDTPFLGSVIRWDHSASWRIPKFTDFIHKGGRHAQHTTTCDLSDPSNQYYLENVVQGQAQYSAGGLLALAAKAYAEDSGNNVEKCPRLLFSDLVFLKPVRLEKDKNVEFDVLIARKTGYFEISVESEIVATGFIDALPVNSSQIGLMEDDNTSVEKPLDSAAIYDELHFRGYGYGRQCQLLKSSTVDGTVAQFKCPTYGAAIDGLVQLAALNDPFRSLVVPRKIRFVRVDIPVVSSNVQKPGGCEAKFIDNLNLSLTAGVEVENIKWEQVTKETPTTKGSLRQAVFVPFQSTFPITFEPLSIPRKFSDANFVQETVGSLIELAVQNSINQEIKIVELIKGAQTDGKTDLLACKFPPKVNVLYKSHTLKESNQNNFTGLEKSSATVLVLRNFFSHLGSNLDEDLKSVSSSVEDDGFLLIIQQSKNPNEKTKNGKPNFDQIFSKNADGFIPLTELYDNGNNFYVLCRKTPIRKITRNLRSVIVFKWNNAATEEDNFWRIQATAVAANAVADSSARIWLIVPRHRTDLVDPVLQFNKEYSNAGLRLIVDDSAEAETMPEFEEKHPFYAKVISRDFVVNIYRNGNWGTHTFRSIPVKQQDTQKAVSTSPLTSQNHYAQASYALLHLARASPGQNILIISDSQNPELEDTIKVSNKIGLTVHVVGPTITETTNLVVKKSHLHNEPLSNVSVAQNILKATEGLGIDVFYNLTGTGKLMESLRVTASSGAAYIEGHAIENLDSSSLSWAASKSVTVHLLDAHKDTVSTSKIVAEFLAESKKDENLVLGLQIKSLTNGLVQSDALFHSKKHYIVFAGNDEHFGIKLAYWLATQGVENIHLHLTSQPTNLLKSHVKFFPALHTGLTTYYPESVEQVVRNLFKDGDVAGVFALQSSELTNSDVMDVTYTVAILDKLTRDNGAENIKHFVLLTSAGAAKTRKHSKSSESLSKIKKIFGCRNRAGLPGLLLDIPSLVATSSNGASIKTSRPNGNFLDLNDVFNGLKTALLRSDKGVFEIVPDATPQSTESDEYRSLSLGFEEETGPQDKSYLPKAVAKIMGIKDFASLDMFLSLADYGIDSLMAIELGNILERDFNLSLTLQEIRSLCIRDICLMSGTTSAMETASLSDIRTEFEKPVLLDTVNKHFNLGEMVPKSTLVLLRQVQDNPQIFFIVHPMEGSVSPVLETLANHLQVTTYGLNCTNEVDMKLMSTLAASYIKEIKKVQPTGPYNIGGYSFGAGVAFEMALQLQMEKKNQVRNLVLLDGSHSFVSTFTKSMKNGYTVDPNMPPEEMEARKQAFFETAILALYVSQLVKTKRNQLIDKLNAAKNFDERVDVTVEELQRCPALQTVDTNILRQATVSFVQRLRIADIYKPDSKYTGKTTLIKCSEKIMKNLGEYYDLDKVCARKEQIRALIVPGNHEGFVLGESARVTAQHINEVIL